jgi:hypothetical protein
MANRFLPLLRPKDGDWTKPLGALVATVGFLWGAWVFLFQEVLRPAVAPVNISLALEIKRLRARNQVDGNPQPVMLTTSAKNSSNKILTIRKTFWVAHAIRLPRSGTSIRPSNSESDLIRDVNDQMSLGSNQLSLEGTATSRYQRSSDAWDVIGFGPLFDVNEIRPSEEIKAQRLILVPHGKSPNDYNLLRVRVIIPSYAKRSNLADEDLIRVVGGISHPSKDFVRVGFCQAERDWRKHGLRWFFDKFALAQDRFDDKVFREPASRYCPTLMSADQKEQVGAQVFTSTYEIPLDIAGESDS